MKVKVLGRSFLSICLYHLKDHLALNHKMVAFHTRKIVPNIFKCIPKFKKIYTVFFHCKSNELVLPICFQLVIAKHGPYLHGTNF